MNKCKNKSCTNEAEEGEKYCKHHQAKREAVIKQAIGGLGTLAATFGMALVKKGKK